MRVVQKALAAVLVVCGLSAALAAEAVIGNVTRCEGRCIEAAANSNVLLADGDPVRLLDRVSTGADGRLEIRSGCTQLTLAEKANGVLDRFVYNPDGTNRFHAEVIGAFRYVSGKLAVGATRQVSISTSIAELGVRGTDS